MNSKYFHGVIRKKRRKLYIHKFQDDDGEWIEGYENIANIVCNHFHHIFTGEEKIIQEEVLNLFLD